MNQMLASALIEYNSQENQNETEDYSCDLDVQREAEMLHSQSSTDHYEQSQHKKRVLGFSNRKASSFALHVQFALKFEQGSVKRQPCGQSSQIKISKENRKQANPSERLMMRIPPALDSPDNVSRPSKGGTRITVNVSSYQVSEGVAGQSPSR